jgi:hypothetical protein
MPEPDTLHRPMADERYEDLFRLISAGAFPPSDTGALMLFASVLDVYCAPSHNRSDRPSLTVSILKRCNAALAEWTKTWRLPRRPIVSG